MVSALESLGFERAALFGASRLTPADLADPDGRVSCEAVDALICTAHAMGRVPNLGLEMARHTPMGAFPLLDYLVRSCDTVDDALRQLVRHFALVAGPITLAWHDDGDAARLEVLGDQDPVSAEYTVAMAVLRLRDETDGGFRPASIHFTHAVADKPAWESAARCAVRDHDAWCGMVVTRTGRELRLALRDPRLREWLERQPGAVAAREAPPLDAEDAARRVLAACALGGDTSLAAVARAVGLSARTLQRRLAERGNSFETLRDEARRNAAEVALTDSQLAIAQVAWLLGFSEAAAFHRAFQRWHGMTPRAFRAARAGGGLR
jgi:AraC-like DNA-binding protein